MIKISTLYGSDIRRYSYSKSAINYYNRVSIKIPDAKTIGLHTFNCDKDTLPPGIEFDDSVCSVLEDVDMSSVETVKKYAFNSCTALREVFMPEVKTIEEYSFNSCLKLMKVGRMSEVETIGDYAFSLCAIIELDIPNVKTIGNHAFHSCTSLREINMSKVKTIGVYAFYTCRSLKKVTIPEVTTIEESTFLNCLTLEEVIIPNVQSIGNYAFMGCKDLRSIVISENVIYNFTCNTNLRNVTINYSRYPTPNKDVLINSVKTNLNLLDRTNITWKVESFEDIENAILSSTVDVPEDNFFGKIQDKANIIGDTVLSFLRPKDGKRRRSKRRSLKQIRSKRRSTKRRSTKRRNSKK